MYFSTFTPSRFLQNFFAEDNNRPIELLRSLQAVTCTQVIEEGRSYGGGLHKLEPREMGNIVLQFLPEWLVVEFEELIREMRWCLVLQGQLFIISN
jgi:hypothetical protein